VVDDGEALAEFVGLFHVMGGEDDGDALGVELADDVPHRDAALRIEAGAGLVQKEDGGAVGDGACNLDALGEAAGELVGEGSSLVGEQELLKQSIGALGGVGAGVAEVAAVEVEVLKNCAGAIEGVVLGDDADVAAGDGGGLDDVNASDAYLAVGREDAGGAHADGGGFAGAIGTEESEDSSIGYFKINAIDGGDGGLSLEDFDELFEFNYQAEPL